jgi:hypothetical protein
MPTKLPTADTNFKQNQSTLARFATNIYNSMGSTQGLIYFPTPTVALTDLVGAINAYTTSLGAARKGYGSKTDTQTKNNAKALLEQYLAINGLYVTQQAQQISGSGTSGVANTTTVSLMRQIITTSGYKLSVIPSPVANTTGIPVPIIKKAISKAIGSVHFLLRQYTATKKGVKTWVVRIRPTSVTPGPWTTVILTSGNMTITGLTSGLNDYQIAAQGGNNTKTFTTNPLNWTAIQQIVVI